MKTEYTILALAFALTACAAPEPVAVEPRALRALPAVGAVPVPPQPAALLAMVEAPAPAKGDFFSSRSRGGRTLIIQSSDPDSKTYANLEEDLSVMYRILSKTRKQDGEGAFKLESFLGGASSSSVRSMYIEGYGAVFMLGVRFPLVAPQPSEEPAKPKDTTSDEWERAKKEIYARNVFEVDVDHIWTKALGSQTEEYDAQKVEDLTAGILEGLKNATHIRNLKTDEFVTVAVLGAEAGQVRAVVEKDEREAGDLGLLRVQPRQLRTAVEKEEREEDGKGKRKTRIENVTSGRGESTMTIRAKKSDIDDFAKGKLNAEAFRKKAKILVYLRPVDPTGKMSVFTPARQ